MRGGILIVVSAIHGVVGYFTRKIKEILLGKPYVIKYGYDALYRLTSVNQDGSLQSRYTFDPMGNRLTSRTSSDTTEYGHDACDEMSYAGDVSYRYDLKGRLISEYDSADNTERTYTWSYDDRLLYINYPDSTKSSMKYDYKGLRTYRKDNAGDITNYYWSLSSLPQVINETDGSGNSKASYILGAGLIAIKVSGVKKYYITDALGSVLALTDNSGNVTDTYEYEPFGELTASTGSSYNPYRFTGQQWDEDSGFYYLRARYYEPGSGRFIARDPIEWAGKTNFYAYCRNNPIKYIDPSGYSDQQPSIVPTVPPGANISQNIQLMQNFVHDSSQLTSLTPVPSTGIFSPVTPFFIYMVRPNGPWDYGSHNQQFGPFGNFNFGVTGTAGGYSEEELLRAAGFVGVYGDFVRPFRQESNPIIKLAGYTTAWIYAYAIATGPLPYGDNDMGQYWTQMGIIFKKQCNLRNHLIGR